MLAHAQLPQVDVVRPLLNAGLWLMLAASAFVAAFAGTSLAAAATPPLELRGGADLVSRLEAGYGVDAEQQRLRRLDPRVIDQAAADERMLRALMAGASNVVAEADRSPTPSTLASLGTPPTTTDTINIAPAAPADVPVEPSSAGVEPAVAPVHTSSDVTSVPVVTTGAGSIAPPLADVPGTGIAPVVGSAVSGVAPVVGAVTGGLAPVVENVLGGVVPVVETVTGGVVAPVVETVTGGVVAPVVETVTGGVGSVVDNVLGGLFR